MQIKALERRVGKLAAATSKQHEGFCSKLESSTRQYKGLCAKLESLLEERKMVVVSEPAEKKVHGPHAPPLSRLLPALSRQANPSQLL